ncbi:MAG TPA: DNA polymerase III subunit delta' [Polyangiaceae bacterium]|nr:DNA polymerase III subunit delta' [Polyangiaceae bacterium]
MAFDGILGQETALQTLKTALASGRLHHGYRFEGPDGVGKEHAAFGLAQALLCPERPNDGCGACSTCRRVVSLSGEVPRVPQHPDVVLVERGLYPPAVLGRSSPETTGIGVEQVRRIVVSRAAYPPYEASHLVFIFRAAHELTPNAANALLKTLEEPRRNVHFVLLTDQPRRLLDTIRSRTLPVRFGPLPDPVLAQIIARAGLQADETSLALAGGSASRLLEACDPEQVAHREHFVAAVLAALRAPDLGATLQLAASQSLDRTGLTRDLRALGQHFALAARREAAGSPEPSLQGARRYGEVLVALDALERNCPPVLALETLVARLRRT